MWAGFWTCLTLLAVGVALNIAAGVPEEGGGPAAFFAVTFSATPFVGALLAARRPANPIGWILLASGLAGALNLAADGYGKYGVIAHPGSLPAAAEVAWLTTVGWLVFALPATFLLLVFPDGRLLSARWRPVGWAAGFGVVLSWAAQAFAPGPLEALAVENPFGLEGAETVPAVAGALGFPLVFAALVAGVVSLVLRYRRGDELRRRQVKWLALVGTLLATTVVGFNVLGGHVPDSSAVALAVELLLFVGLPAAVAIAVLRHRLYDIDRLIRRSMVYAALGLLITVAYVAVAAALGIAAGRNLPVWAAVLLTIGVTLVFQPARRQLEGLAERLVFGARKSGYDLLTEFGATLRDAFDLLEVAPRLASTVRGGLDLRWVRISLVLDADGAPTLQPVAAHGLAPDAAAEPATVTPLRHGGEDLGVIECGPKTEGELTDKDRELLTTLASQAAVAIRNARLASELTVRLEQIREQAAELAASRARIVQAQDAERRRIERNIHDGAQQEITGLIAKLRLARNQLRTDLERADVALVGLQDDAREILAGLRELAQGIHPSVLTDRGLIAAIEARADRSPVPVVVEVEQAVRGVRFTDDVEGAAYFVVSEALANALKHSAASEARVRIGVSDNALRVQVSDDGIGFDPSVVRGSGLANLDDRVQAVGGKLHVDARCGGGSVVTATLPWEARTASRA